MSSPSCGPDAAQPILLLRSRSLRLSAILMFILQMACGSSEPPLTPLPPDATVLAFGNSLTYGTGAGIEQSYPAALERLVERTVVRAGVPGEVSADGLRRLPAVLEKYRPQLVILCHGGNDMLRKLDELALRANLRTMIETARAHGAEVLLVGVPKPGLFLSSAALYQALADELEVPLENDALAEILADRSLKSDTIHPNAAGYRKLAEALAKVLERSGAI